MQSKLKKVINPPEFLGILGGGQLGCFFTIAAQKMGYSVVVFDPDKQSPAGKIAEKHICKPYNDLKALDELKASCSAVTTEFENVPAETLKYLEKDIIIRPNSKAISIAQNRIKEKDFLKNLEMPIGTYVVIDSIESINNINEKLSIFPGILKIAEFGYDGKGQIHVNNKAELGVAFKTFKSVPCTLELKLNLDSEFSIVLARSVDGEFIEYPPIHNIHNSGILEFSSIPNTSCGLHDKLYINLTKRIANELNYIGVIAIEFFISNEKIYVNEVAPRPHNSGHHSIDSCDFNQFDQQVFTLTGASSNDPKLITSAVMVNLLGDIWFKDGKLSSPNFDIFEEFSNEVLHIYGKHEARPGRKMGHFTVIGDNIETSLIRAKKIKTLLSKK